MDLREFVRFHLLKALLVFIVVQIAIVAIVQNYNHRPQAQPDQASVIEDRTVKISPLFNDADKDETDELTILKFSKPIHGSIEQKGNLLYYSPAKGFAGIDSFTYTISDGRKESKNSFITIRVNKNKEPVANRDVADVYSDGATLVDVLKNDLDIEKDSIFIKQYSQPLYGNLNLIGNKFIYSSKVVSAMADSFSYVLSDGKNSSKPATVFIDIRSKSHPCYPWLSCDVGDAAILGSFTSIDNTLIVKASGSDIWNSADGFRYAFQYVSGDCEMYTKVESIEGSNEWAKAGIMVRESLSGGSSTAYVCVTTRNGITHHQRLLKDESIEGGARKFEIKAPYWLKLVRKGDTFSYYTSADGKKWESLGTKDVAMASNVYIGFAVTSHNNNELCKAVFSNYQLVGKVSKF